MYLFDVQLVLIPPHTSHLLQPFDVVVASPLKNYFKEELVSQKFNNYIQNGIDIIKQTRRELRDSLIHSFINSLRKSCTIENIQSGFRQAGIVPINAEEPLSSQYSMLPENEAYNRDDLLKDYCLNSEENLKEIFLRENGRPMTEEDFTVNLKNIVRDIKNASIKDGISLSELPPLYNDDDSKICGYRL